MICNFQMGPEKQTEDQKERKWKSIATLVGIVFLFLVFVLPTILSPEKLTLQMSEEKCEPYGFTDHKKYTDNGWEYSGTSMDDDDDFFGTGVSNNGPCFTRAIRSHKPFEK